MSAKLKKHVTSSSHSSEHSQLIPTVTIGKDWNTLPTELLLQLLIEACVADVKDGADHNQVLSTLSDVCHRWRELVEGCRPDFIKRILKADLTYDYGSESRVKEINFSSRRYPTMMAADGQQLYVLSYESIGQNWQTRRIGIQVCDTTGWDLLSRDALTQANNVRFHPTRRLVLEALSVGSSIRCMQVSEDLQVVYLVQMVTTDDGDNDSDSDSESDSDSDSESENDDNEVGGVPLNDDDGNAADVESSSDESEEEDEFIPAPAPAPPPAPVHHPASVNYVCRVHSVTGILLSRWRIDASVVFPSDWQHSFMTIEPRTGNVVIPDAYGHRVLEYSADGVLLHEVSVGGSVPVVKAYRLPYVPYRRPDDGNDDVVGEPLAYIVALKSVNLEDVVKFCFKTILCTALTGTSTCTPVKVTASYNSMTSLFDVIDVCHGHILFAEWSRGCRCCVKHCHVRLHRVEDLRPSRRDDVHEPLFYGCEESRWLCFDRKSRMLFIAGYALNMHCVNLWRRVE